VAADVRSDFPLRGSGGQLQSTWPPGGAYPPDPHGRRVDRYLHGRRANSLGRSKHPPYEILAVAAECWLFKESRDKLVILDFKDEFLPESATPLMLHFATTAVRCY